MGAVSSRRAIRVALILASLLPAAVITVLILARSPNIPLGDQWTGSVVTVLRAADGSLRAADLFEWHTVHRPVFSRGLAVLLAETTHWDLRVESAVSVLLTLTVLYLTFRMLPSRLGAARFWLLPLIALLLFTTRASWVRSWHNAWFFARFFWVGFLAVVAVGAMRWRTLFTAAGLVTCATFSQGVGLVLWPLGSFQLWLSRYRRLAFHCCWLALGAVVLALFYRGFRLPHYLAGREAGLGILGRLEFVVAFLGGPLVKFDAEEVRLATGLGTLGMGLLLVDCWSYFRRQGRAEEIAPWLGMSGFAFGIAALSSLGRTGMGSHHAMNPRYVIVAALFWVGLLVIGVLASLPDGSSSRRPARAVVVLNLIVLLGGALLFARAYADGARQSPEVTPRERDCFLAYPATRETGCMDRLERLLRFSSREGREVILDRVDALARHGLTAFAAEGAADAQVNGLSESARDSAPRH